MQSLISEKGQLLNLANIRATPNEVAEASSSDAHHLTAIQWLVCAVACLGFAFDLYETLMMPLVMRPVLGALGNLRPGMPSFNLWAGLLFFIPSAVGGVFGLLGGYLADLVGRRRVLVWSILLYGASACAASYSTSLHTFLVLRCATMIGVYVEYVAGVTWLAELFCDSKQRETVLGFEQGFFSVGGLMVTGAYFLAVTYAERLPTILARHEAWRYTLLSGTIPALPLLLVRPFLPESPFWRERKVRGMLKRPSVRELFRPALLKTTVVVTLLAACSFALVYGAIQHTVRMIPGLPQVRNLAPRQVEQRVSGVQLFQELGGLAGRVVFALFIVRIVTQRVRAWVFFLPSLAVFSWLYFFAATHSLGFVHLGIFVASLLFNGLHSLWGSYLPRVYPTHLRGTGDSFAMNIGGRTVGASSALLTTQLANVMPGAAASTQLAYAAAAVSLLACIVGLIASIWLCEPDGNRLPD